MTDARRSDAPPTVSVLVTSYNREKYLAASIESVLVQSFRDFELLVVDNRSTDRSVAIAEEYAARDPRVRVVVNERNLGQFGNRNRAASLVRGRFLKYHDSDDLMYPHGLETMVRLLDAEPAAGFALTTGWHWPGGPCPMLATPRQAYQREFLGFGMFAMGPSCALFRREVFDALGGFDEHGVASDNVFWLKACRRFTALLVPGDLFWYRTHAGQEFLSERADSEYAAARAEVWKALHAPDCPLEGGELLVARRNWTWVVARGIWRRLRAGNLAAAWRTARGAGLSIGDWARYLRRPARNNDAGGPADETVPPWLALAPERPRGASR